MVVDDELTCTSEYVCQPDGAVGSVKGVVGELDHGEASAGGGDGVEFTRRRFLACTELGQRGVAVVLIDDGRDGYRSARVG